MHFQYGEFTRRQGTGHISSSELRKATGWDEDRARLALVTLLVCLLSVD